MSRRKSLLITTEKGVFFGYGTPRLGVRDIRLTRCRMVVYWSADVRSVLGLAANGPTSGCRVGPPAPAVIIKNVTLLAECSKEAVSKFEEGPWSA